MNKDKQNNANLKKNQCLITTLESLFAGLVFPSLALALIPVYMYAKFILEHKRTIKNSDNNIAFTNPSSITIDKSIIKQRKIIDKHRGEEWQLILKRA